MLELRNINKTLGGKPVLNNLSLRIERGETMVVVGSSGAGKSVALQHMIGLLKPDSGEVLLEGQPIQNASGNSLEQLRQCFGMLFQGGALINWMNIFDNIALPLRERGCFSEQDVKKRVRKALELVNLTDIDKKMPVSLSGGMTKRAGLARAIVTEPPIILYDEPTAGLDPILSRSIDRLIQRLQDEMGVTSVVVTHDLVSAFAVGDKIALIQQGQIASLGTKEEFKQDTSPLVREFIEAQFGTNPDTEDR